MVMRIILSFIVFLNRSLRLVISPYKTMRVISHDKDILQLLFIFGGVGGYFLYANTLRQYAVSPLILFFLTVLHFALTVCFFVFLRMWFGQKENMSIRSILLLFGYALIPTLCWFLTNSLLYRMLPPPRTVSVLGLGFSITYISYSLAILFWKIVLLYLAVRHTLRLPFFRVIYGIVLYLMFVIPYSLVLYSLQLFRIPFL